MSMEGEGFVHVSQARTDRFPLLLFYTCVLSLDDKCVETMLFTLRIITLYLFSNWGTPPLNSFGNEMDVFQYFTSNSHTDTPFN